MRPVVVLDRFDPGQDLHRRNRGWLVERDAYRVVAVPGEEAVLADLVVGAEVVPSPERRGQARAASGRPPASTSVRLKGRASRRSSVHPSSPRAS